MSWIKPIKKGVSLTAPVLSGFKKAIVSGLMPSPKNAPIRTKIWRGAVKTTAIGGMGYGAYKAQQSLLRPRSRQDYVTFLRNNILAGKISPEELSLHDMESVKRLGLR